MTWRFGLPAGGRDRAPPTPDQDPLSNFRREMDILFDDFLRPFGQRAGSLQAAPGMLSPRIDVAETPEAWTVTAELPGIEENDIDLKLIDRGIVIRAEKKGESEQKDKSYRLVERSYGMVERTIPLPFQPDGDDVSADFANGILTVVLPKPPEVQKSERKIEVGSRAK